MTSTSETREIWEDVIAEFPKMWMQDTYEGYEGKFWSLPPRKILPKPWKKPHPPMWYAAGNTSSYEMCAQRGLGVLGFSVGDLDDMAPMLKRTRTTSATPSRSARSSTTTSWSRRAAFVKEDPRRRGSRCVDAKLNYLQSNVFRYHDTFPHPDGCRYWPELIPDFDADTVEVHDRHRRGHLRRSRRGPRAVSALGVIGCGPVGVRDRLRDQGRDARDDPAHGRARDPEDRHRSCAPHHAPSVTRGRADGDQGFGASAFARREAGSRRARRGEAAPKTAEHHEHHAEHEDQWQRQCQDLEHHQEQRQAEAEEQAVDRAGGSDGIGRLGLPR